MHLVGDDGARVESYLRIVVSAIDMGTELERALTIVPSDIRQEVEAAWRQLNSGEKTITLSRITMISDPSTGPRPWFAEYDPASGYHWYRLRQWLLTGHGFDPRIVESLDDASDRILSHLESPSPDHPEDFRIQGLVLGRIQSGKTSNYTALIAKAVDAGYKLVIVLAGIHNQLRWQTQQRLTKDLGLEAIIDGIPIPEPGHRWFPITECTYDGDFRLGSAQVNLLGELPGIAVVKKNTTVLTRLLEWLSTRPQPAHLPVLIIDDEADQASINTGTNRDPLVPPVDLREIVDLSDHDIADPSVDVQDEIEPSKINSLVRQLIGEFERVSYVAYTATPFANVLIEPTAVDSEMGQSLYPRDFIVTLPTPTDYIGAERLFPARPDDTTDRRELNVVSIVPDLDASLVMPKHEIEPIEMVGSLKCAILDFVLAAAAKDSRESQLGRERTATMLIHTSYRVFAQIRLGELVRNELRNLRNLWRYGTFEEFDEETQVTDRWLSEFQLRNSETSDLQFSKVKPYIDRLFREGVSICVFNSETDDQLTYGVHRPRRVVVVGGNRLSRGITLEDLTVSYYTRESNNYDTIMQAGRWFGYREGYADLTRLWITAEKYRDFRHLAEVEEDLRAQIDLYSEMGKSPSEISPLLLTHPDLNVTGLNRMGAAREYQTSFAGQFIQSVRLHLTSVDRLRGNLESTKQLIAELGVPDTLDHVPENTWEGIDWQLVFSFLGEFDVPRRASRFRPSLLADYIQRQARYSRELTRWWIVLITRRRPDSQLGIIDLGGAVGEINPLSRSRLMEDRESVGVLANPPTSLESPGDEAIGLGVEQVARAWEAKESGQFRRYSTALRYERDSSEGLLCVYPISQYSRGGISRNRTDLFDDAVTGVPVIGLSILFPPSESAATKTRVGGPLAAEPL